MALIDVRNQVAAILNRNDASTARLNSFINQAQTRIERTLRVPGIENYTVITGADPTVSPTVSFVIPDDFLSMKYMYCGETLMVTKDLGHFLRVPQAPGSGPCPGSRYYCRVGASFLIKPTLPEGDTITMVYHQAQPVLVNDTDENFWTVVAPDLLSYAALSYAGDFFVDDRTQTFEGRYAQLYSDMEEQARLTEMEQSAMAIAPAYNTEY